MIRRPPRSTRTDTLFPYTTLFRSVLAQTPVAILPGDTADSLADRVRIAEHQLYPATLAAYVMRERTPAWLLGRVRDLAMALPETDERSEERRVGKGCVRPCRSRG